MNTTYLAGVTETFMSVMRKTVINASKVMIPPGLWLFVGCRLLAAQLAQFY